MMTRRLCSIILLFTLFTDVPAWAIEYQEAGTFRAVQDFRAGITIKGVTQDGTTNLITGRDSTEATVFSVDTNGVLTGLATSLTGLPLTTGVTGILPGANGGTGIAYFTAAGPTTARVYTFPDVAGSVPLLEVTNSWTAIQYFDAGFDVRYSSTLFDRFSVDSSGALLIKATEKAPPAVTASLAGAGAGNVDNGTHSYKITWVTAAGETDAGEVSNVVTVTDKTTNGKVTVPRPTDYSSFVTGWRVYRTVAGNTGKWLLVNTSGNVSIGTNSYTDNISDSNLGSEIPSLNGALNQRIVVSKDGFGVNVSDPGGGFAFSKSQNDYTQFRFLNPTNGTGAAAQLIFGTAVTGGAYGYLAHLSASYVPSSTFDEAGSTVLFAGSSGVGTSGTLGLVADRNPVKFYASANGSDFPVLMTLLPNGNFGIGTSTITSGQKLEINGGMNLTTATAQPTCTSTTRGTFWVVQNGAGVKDQVEVCAKAADNSYAWRVIY